jgi:thioesterase domain-containing protein
MAGDKVSTQSKNKKLVSKKTRHKNKSSIYVMRGLANVFSLGMNNLSNKFTAKGMNSKVYNHSRWGEVSQRIIADKKAGNRGRVVLIGHSLGANAIVKIAQKLKAHKIKVDLLIAFDPTVKLAVPSNVKHTVNYYRESKTWGTKLIKAKGYRGRFNNVELSKRKGTDHFNIDESKYLHSKVMRMVVRTVGRYK